MTYSDKLIINVSTGEVTRVPLSAEEIAQRDADSATALVEALIDDNIKFIAEGADDEARLAPDFMGWTPAEAEQWVIDNVTDLATAKLALRKMALNVAALNAKAFPHIRYEVNNP